MKWPDRILVYGCESCSGVGTHPNTIHHDCEAVRDWHQWFADNPNMLTRGENPVKVPIKMLAYLPGDEPEIDLDRGRR